MSQRLNRIKGILAAEAKAISSVEIDDRYDQAIELMKTCEGKLIITGIGKAGFIAKKFAATLCSTGTPAVYIHPAEAAHGDLGVIEKNDLIFADRKSVV